MQKRSYFKIYLLYLKFIILLFIIIMHINTKKSCYKIECIYQRDHN